MSAHQVSENMKQNIFKITNQKRPFRISKNDFLHLSFSEIDAVFSLLLVLTYCYKDGVGV